jgi:transposase
VVAFVLRWHSRTRFRINSQEIHGQSKRTVMRKTFKYRLFPTAAQQELLRVQLSEACRLYNAALQERRDAYQTHKKSLNYYDQANQLKEIRARGDLSLANYHCCQDVLKRIDKAFKAFFRRCQSGQQPGFPRFKSHRRYDSITFPSHGDGNKLLNRHLRVQDPRGTSQRCPCGKPAPKKLSDRKHVCECGLQTTRDHASSLEILRLGLSLQAPTKPEVRVCVA